MRARILGSAQDGGVPHLGCGCDRCAAARGDRSMQRSPASLKVYDEEKEVNYLFDVSPDIRFQIGDEYIDGIFVSHAHLGHVTGLLYLGTESFNADMVPVHCSETVEQFLQDHPSYRVLIDRNNITTHIFDSGDGVEVLGLEVTPVSVSNTGYVETDTHGFLIETEDTTLFYATDTDRWTDEEFERIAAADVAVLDGSFWSREEIDRYQHVPHPPIKETLEKVKDLDTTVYFTHMNHTNPVLDPESDERQQVEDAGCHIAEDGTEIEL